MNISEKNMIGDIVAQDYRTASVFQFYNIDFCCSGNRTIASVSKKANIDPTALINELNQTMNQKKNVLLDFNDWPIDLLADYIEKKHHRYVEQKLKEIIPLIQKIVEVHGKTHPELKTIEELFTESAKELMDHMKREEKVLFPYVRKMVSAMHQNAQMPSPSFEKVENPISLMQQDHNVEGERFRQISALTNNYSPPSDACQTYKTSFAMLKEFEQDLHLHIHLENNILFPKAIEMEKALVVMNA